MNAGYVFGQTGRLQLSKKHDSAWQASVMGLYQEVREIVTQELGYDIFLFLRLAARRRARGDGDRSRCRLRRRIRDDPD